VVRSGSLDDPVPQRYAHQSIRMLKLLLRANRRSSYKTQMSNVQAATICEEDGGQDMVVVEPPCKNRLRSTAKCRRKCCRRKTVNDDVVKTVQSRLVKRYSTRSLRELAEERIKTIGLRGATVHGLNLPDSGSRGRKNLRPSPPVEGKEDAK